ncbi:MAG: 30S ribosomal protein S9 [Candidatus Pacebacteria bacterium]|nr:30S ribosomal protein S9 [Candidatus Paceibacterota bacterium]MCF7862913.1 30S ribosomal protein S9 [Candidatus Paceibacterota bacterium]
MTKEKSKDEYIEAVGRRKTSTARVRIFSASKNSISVNGMDAKEYFKTEETRRLVQDPILKGVAEVEGKSNLKWKVEAKVLGGGHHSQAEAVRHGLARAICISDIEFRPQMKDLGFLKRDPRSKERRKFGLKKARKAPKWSKR